MSGETHFTGDCQINVFTCGNVWLFLLLSAQSLQSMLTASPFLAEPERSQDEERRYESPYDCKVEPDAIEVRSSQHHRLQRINAVSKRQAARERLKPIGRGGQIEDAAEQDLRNHE